MKKKINNDNEVKVKLIKDVNDDTNQFRKFVFILLGVAVIAGLLYVLTAKFLVKDNFQAKEAEKAEVSISYDSVNTGNVFNRPYDKYYVFAYETEGEKSAYYTSLVNAYKKDSKIYTLDLSKEINKAVEKKVSNKNASKPSELSIINPTLIEIQKGKIINYYDNISDIEKVLK